MALDAILVRILARRPDRARWPHWALATLRTVRTRRPGRPHGTFRSCGTFTAGCQRQQKNDCGKEDKFPHHLHLRGEGFNLILTLQISHESVSVSGLKQ